MNGQRLAKRLKNKSAKLVLVLFCLAIDYLFFSLAIDRGDLWYYLLTLIFLVLSLRYLFALIGDVYSGLKRR
jgi:hypothetical protein